MKNISQLIKVLTQMELNYIEYKNGKLYRVRDYKTGEKHAPVEIGCRNGTSSRRYIYLYRRNNGKRTKIPVHRIIWHWFNGLDEIKNDLKVVNHIDGDRTNNKIENLELITKSDNTKHWHDNLKGK